MFICLMVTKTLLVVTTMHLCLARNLKVTILGTIAGKYGEKLEDLSTYQNLICLNLNHKYLLIIERFNLR